MLSKNKRLNLSTDFEWVRLGKEVRAPHFRLFGRYGDNRFAKAGVAIVSKQFPKATQRNKAKRVMFSAFEKVYDSLPNNFNIMALPNKGIDNVKSEDLVSELREVLEKVL